MKRARSLARLNGRILNVFSRRTTAALRSALPLRLALPHLEPTLALNVAKEIRKDALVLLRASQQIADQHPAANDVLSQLLDATKEIDRSFLNRVGKLPVGIVIRYEEIGPIRARRIKLLYDAAVKTLTSDNARRPLREALQTTFSQDDFRKLLDELFRLYVEETRSLSRSVRLPRLMAPIREMIAQEVYNVMIGVARKLALEIVAAAFTPAASERRATTAGATPTPS